MPVSLPDLQARNRIVNPDGTPTFEFHRFFNIDFSGALEGILTDIQDVQDGLVAANALIAAQQAEIVAIQAEQAQQILDIQAILGISQAAVAAANEAQTTADEALANGTTSGSASNPSVDILAAGWVNGPQVDLTGVVAGDLTITGTGPQQDGDVTLSGSFPGSLSCEFRVVEIDGMTETTVYTGAFRVTISLDESVTVINDSASEVAAFVLARTSTGAISYRIDVQRLGSRDVGDLLTYIYARRAA